MHLNQCVTRFSGAFVGSSTAPLTGTNLTGAVLTLAKFSESSLQTILADRPDLNLCDYLKGITWCDKKRYESKQSNKNLRQTIDELISYLTKPSIGFFSSHAGDLGKYRARALLTELVQNQTTDSPNMKAFLKNGILQSEQSQNPAGFWFSNQRPSRGNGSLHERLQKVISSETGSSSTPAVLSQ